MSDLPRRQLTTLNAICDFIASRGYSPTVRELCELTGRSSSGTVAVQLGCLRAKGYITFEDGKSRTIRVLVHPPSLPSAESSTNA